MCLKVLYIIFAHNIEFQHGLNAVFETYRLYKHFNEGDAVCAKWRIKKSFTKTPKEAYDFPYGSELLSKFLKPFLSNINCIEPGQIAWIS